MKRVLKHRIRLIAPAFVVLLLATADLSARFLRSAAGFQAQGAATPQVQLEHRANTSNPFHVEFRDVTHEAGIHFHHDGAKSAEKLYLETMGAGVAWLDYNQDGYMDAFFVNSGDTPYFHPPAPPQPALYRNNGDGTFTDVTAESKIHADGTFFFGVARSEERRVG